MEKKEIDHYKTTNNRYIIDDRIIEKKNEQVQLDLCWNNIKNIQLIRNSYDSNIFSVCDQNIIGYDPTNIESIFPKSIHCDDTIINKKDIVHQEINPNTNSTISTYYEQKVILDQVKILDETQIYRTLLGAFQESQKKIENLEARIKVLEERS